MARHWEQALNNQVLMLFESNQPHMLSFKDAGIDPKTWNKKGGFLAKDKKGFQVRAKPRRIRSRHPFAF